MLKKVGRVAERMFRESKGSRQVTVPVVEASATATASGTKESRENSAPASRNVVEVAKKLDDVLTALGSSDEFPIDQMLLDVVSSQAEKYPQYKLSSGSDEWTCSDRMKTTIMLAANASEAAYGRKAQQEPEFLSAVDLKVISEETYPSSFDGSIKQLAVRTFVRLQSPNDTGKAPMLFIAIKGSASFVDWITNLNGDPAESSFVSTPEAEARDMAHRGLLRAAEKLEPKITRLMEKLSAPTGESRLPPSIVLTGHSAGGGVAALLYLHYLNHNQCFGGLDIQCITFAAPPVIASGPRNPRAGFISFVNEGDPVPRMDKSYILSIADLYRLSRTSDISADGPATNRWIPPPAQLHIPAESSIIVLHIKDEDEIGFDMKLCRCKNTELEQTLALDFERHHMRWYLKEISDWIQRSRETM